MIINWVIVGLVMRCCRYDIDLLLKIEELLGKKIDKLELPHDEVMQLKQRVSDAQISAKTVFKII